MDRDGTNGVDYLGWNTCVVGTVRRGQQPVGNSEGEGVVGWSDVYKKGIVNESGYGAGSRKVTPKS